MNNKNFASFRIRLFAGLAALAAICLPMMFSYAQTTATMYTDGTNFGIGTTGPTQKLQVVGTVAATAFSGDGSGLTGISAGGWTDGGANVFNTLTTDLVGIGTTTPSTTLEIVQQSTNPALMVSSVFNGDGNLLIVHSGGNVGIGTTQPIAKIVIENTGSIDSFRVNDSTADISPFIISQDGNVGINTTTSFGLMHIYNPGTTGNLLRITDTSNDTSPFVIEGNNGNVGIGTGDPGSKLTVISGISLGSGNSGSSAPYMTVPSPVGGMSIQGNVGIGTWESGGSLEIVRTASVIPLMVSSAATINGDYFIVTSAGNVGVGTTNPGPLTAFEVRNGNVGIGTALTNSGVAIMNGNVGIGTWSPRVLVEMSTTGGTLNNVGAGDVYIQNDLEVDGVIYGDGSGLTNISAGGWTDSGTNVFTSTTTDNVGIGTTTPNATLTVRNITSSDSFRVDDTTSDPSPFVITDNGSIGIGTFNPEHKMIVRTTTSGLALSVRNDHIVTMGDPDGVNGGTVFSVNDVTASAYLLNAGLGIGTTSPVGALTVMNGNVGIGTWSPEGALVVMNGSVGIGSISPTNKLTVAGGSMRIVNPGNPALFFLGTASGGAGPGGYLAGICSTCNTGDYAQNDKQGGLDIVGYRGITFSSDGWDHTMTMDEQLNVGIGTYNPTAKLAVIGDTRIGMGTFNNPSGNHDLFVTGNLEVDGILYGDGSGLTGISAGGWTDGGTNVFTSTTTDNVAIGTTTPSSTLEIVKTAAGTSPLMVSSAATTDGDLFIIGSSGSIGIGTTLASATTALTVMSGNVGVGTWVPGGSIHTSLTAYAQLPLFERAGQTSDGQWNGVRILATKTSDMGDGFGSGIAFNIRDDAGTINEIGGVVVVRDVADTSGAIRFINFLSGSPSVRMEIDSSGSVGIGTTLAVGGTSIMNGNVGIGTWSPTNTLHVIGGVTATGTFTSIYGDVSAYNILGANLVTGNAGYFGTNVGIGTNLQPSGTGLSVMSGNVGIGTWSPTQRLQVVGTVAATAFTGDGSGLTGISAGGWTDGGANVFTSLTTDNVGIGTTTPTSTLELVKTAAGTAPFMVSTAATTDGDYLVVTSSGAVGIGTANVSATTGLSIMNGNVGIGTWSPTARLIVRDGNVGVGTFKATYAKLDVIGPDGSAYGPFGGTGIDANAAAIFRNHGSNSDSAAVQIVSASFGTADLKFGDVDDAFRGSLSFDNNDDSFNLMNTSSAYIMKIGQNGNVGIGTSLVSSGFSVMTGNVGIGTWKPISSLEVTSTQSQDLFRVNDNGPADSSPAILVDQNGSVGIGTSTATNGVLIVQGGNVGIGTMAPSGAFVVMNGNVGVGTWNPRARLEVRNTIAFGSEYDEGSEAGAFTIDWNNGNKQKVTLTGSTSHAATFTAPSGGVANYLIKIVQGDASNTITWPGTVKWPSATAPTLSATSGYVDIVTCYYDGTNYYCVGSLDFR